MSNTKETGAGYLIQESNKGSFKGLYLFLMIFLFTVVLNIIIFFNDVFIVIKSGQVGVLWNRFGGTKVDKVYDEGLTVISPLDNMYIYEVRNQIVSHELNVLSVDGLKIGLQLSIRFRPEVALTGLLHDHIGIDYLTRIVIPQIESVLRKQLGVATAEQIYTNENGLLNQAMLNAIAEVGRNFVEVEDIIIRQIQLPEAIQQAIEDKLVQQELLASYKFRTQIAINEAERKRIESKGISDYNEIISSTISNNLLRYQGIRATLEIAGSENNKTVVIGGNEDIPIVLSTVPVPSASTDSQPEK